MKKQSQSLRKLQFGARIYQYITGCSAVYNRQNFVYSRCSRKSELLFETELFQSGNRIQRLIVTAVSTTDFDYVQKSTAVAVAIAD